MVDNVTTLKEIKKGGREDPPSWMFGNRYSRGTCDPKCGPLARRIKQICKGYIEWDRDDKASFVVVAKKQKTKSSPSSELSLTLAVILEDTNYLKDNVKGYENVLNNFTRFSTRAFEEEGQPSLTKLQLLDNIEGHKDDKPQKHGAFSWTGGYDASIKFTNQIFGDRRE